MEVLVCNVSGDYREHEGSIIVEISGVEWFIIISFGFSTVGQVGLNIIELSQTFGESTCRVSSKPVPLNTSTPYQEHCQIR
jgi:hypothetical protein